MLALAGTAAATLGTVIIIVLSERSKHNSSPRYTLSKRYQQLENHKAMKCTVVYVSFAGMMNIIFSVLYLLNQYADSRYWANVAGIAINVHIAIYANIMQYVGYISNRQMYELTSGIAMKKLREIRDLFPGRRRIHEAQPLEPKARKAIGINGKELYVEAKQDDYFSQLEAQWNEKLP
ncbi:unnamed protein product, partial [Mesorhabditis spiculigera]